MLILSQTNVKNIIFSSTAAVYDANKGGLVNETSKLIVYNILVIQKPLENSTINFLAPIIINEDNKKLAQFILEPRKNPDFGMAESIKSFKQ
mgnify:CR=1 FL=1